MKNKLAVDKMRYALILLFPLLSVAYLHYFALDSIWYDDFVYIKDIFTPEDMPPFKFFFSARNGHRLFFPTIVSYALWKMTGIDGFIGTYISLILLTALYVPLCLIYGKSRSFIEQGLLTTCLGLIFFSPFQYETRLWGSTISSYMACVLAYFSFFFFCEGLAREKRKNICLAVCLSCLVVATFSLFSGLMGWFALMRVIIGMC